MTDNNYQIAFYEFTHTLDNVLLAPICMEHKIEVTSFLAWVAADTVRQAKMQEVVQTRIVAMEKAK